MKKLELQNISKAFGPVQALKKVSLKVEPGRVHALIGENGAGKSTLMKILSGDYQADSGKILLDDSLADISSPAKGRAAGIAMIYQELTLAPHMSVHENITLGAEPSKAGFALRDPDGKVRKSLDFLGHHELSIDSRTGDLPIGTQQVVEIARAIYSGAKIIIMDEPTSSLSAVDTRNLFKVIKRLRNENYAIIYISHFLEEVQEIADDYTVLRDGESVDSGKIADVSIDDIVRMMVGRELTEMYPAHKHQTGDVVLKSNDLKLFKDSPPVSLSLRKGEILGIAGLIGSGRTELLRQIFGLDKTSQGITIINGREFKAAAASPSASLKRGLDFLSENRKEEGLAVKMSLCENLTLSALSLYSRLGFINHRKERRAAAEYLNKLTVKYNGDVMQKIDSLSGGNQQKVAIARLMHHDSGIFFLDEPTRGIDVGSKTEIYKLINQHAASGRAIIFVSSYLPELLGVCDSLAVMHRGGLSGIKPVSEWDEDSIMRYATSG